MKLGRGGRGPAAALCRGGGVLVGEGKGRGALGIQRREMKQVGWSIRAMRGWGGGATASLSSPALMAAADGEIGGRTRYWYWDSFYRHGMGRGVSWEARSLRLEGNATWGRSDAATALPATAVSGVSS